MGNTLAAGPVHGVGPGRDDHAWGTQGWRAHAATVGSALATLAVILAGVAFAGLGSRNPVPPDDDRAVLTDLGRRAINELPLAYQAGDAVVVPAATDPAVHWTGPVSLDRIHGHAVPLGARGLVDYGAVTSSVDAPAWVDRLTSGDRVFADVGALFFACTTWPGQDACSASVLMYHDTKYYFYVSGLGSEAALDEGAPMEVFGFKSVNGTELQELLVGRLGGIAAEEVRLTMPDGTERTAWTSKGLVLDGETLWTAATSQPVRRVTAYDADGEVLATQRLND